MANVHTETESPARWKYYGPALVYAVALGFQLFEWLTEPYVSQIALFSLFFLIIVHLFCIFTVNFERVNFNYWFSLLLWISGIFITFRYAHAMPSLGFCITATVCLMLMYEAYAYYTNEAGCRTLRQNIFPRIFTLGKNRVSSSPNGTVDSPKPITQKQKMGGNFSLIYGLEDEKKRIKQAALDILLAKKSGKQARNGILLTGLPGNGKTELARALAGELNLPYIEITQGMLASEWVNETTVKLMRALNEAKQSAPCVLFVDEIDSLLTDRSKAQRSDTEDSKIVNALLTELVNLRSHGVIIVAATNHIEKLDGAGIREGRFDFKIEIGAPSEKTRVGIMLLEIYKQLPTVKIETGAVETVAKRWNGFSVVRIISVVKELASMHREAAFVLVTSDLIFEALRRIQGSLGLNVSNAKGVDNMFLPAEMKADLQSIVYRMRNIQAIEAAGGSMPTGLIFYGSKPGTGKTECARSIAKDSGWAFLATTSNDIIHDPSLIDSLYKDALNMRPCIIFIDEANDIFRDRSYSHHSALTNKLLTIMDGVTSEARDIMFIAATNYIEHIDSAVLRGGRISEKFHFTSLSFIEQAEFLEVQMSKSKSGFEADVCAEAIVALAAEHEISGTVSNLSVILKDAINNMVVRKSTLVSMKDLEKAVLRQKV